MRTAYGLDSGVDAHWLLRAACRDHDPNMWVTGGTGDYQQRLRNLEAKKICDGCPVRAECAELIGPATQGLILAGQSVRVQRKDTWFTWSGFDKRRA